jgi:Transposase
MRDFVSVQFSHTCSVRLRTRFCSHRQFCRWRTGCRQFANVTVRLFGGRTMRHGFKASSISVSIARLTGFRIKAFGNWRARFKAEPHPPARKVLYRRGGVSHGLSHGLSHDLRVPGPIVPPAREGRRRRFSEADKQQILEEAMRPDARFSDVARRYGIAERVLFRWKQELTQVAPLFVAVEIADATSPTEEQTS